MRKLSSGVLITLVALLSFTSCEKLNPNAPQSCFAAMDVIVAGVPTMFNSSCSVNAVSFSWTFGDGNASSEANPSHTYSEGGTFTVTLVVTNADGDTDESSLSITVEAPSIIEHSGTIDEDETWIEGTHLITGIVRFNAILTIEPGATILFAQGARLDIGNGSGVSGATLIANGTAAKPITFTSAAATKTPGDWDYIGFYDAASSASSMQYCIIEYGGGYSENYGAVYITGSSVSIENCTIRYSENHGISLTTDGWFESFENNTMEENGLYAITLYGNYAHTIGSGNTLTSDRGIFVRADEMEQENATWLKQTCPYVLDGILRIESNTGAKLTIMPGADIRFTNSARVYVGNASGEFGTLVAEGTDSERIQFTSAAPEATRSPGDWDGIWFYDGAGTSSSFAYCDVSYSGGYSANYGMLHVDGSSIAVTNSTFKNSQTMGISLADDGSFQTFSDNTFEGNADFPIQIFGNHVHTIGTGNTFNTGPGIEVRADKLEQSDVTWLKQNVPYILDGIFRIESNSGSKLTIEPGTTVKFTESARIYVGNASGEFGILVADGEPDNKITFTSAAPAGFESQGDWDGIWFYNGTGNGTILDNCVISYGGGYSSNSGNLNMLNQAPGIPEISNCLIENSGSYGIYLGNNASPTLTNNTFSNNVSGDTNL
jgi:parallel beta-helix repeat protein